MSRPLLTSIVSEHLRIHIVVSRGPGTAKKDHLPPEKVQWRFGEILCSTHSVNKNVPRWMVQLRGVLHPRM